MKFTADDIRLMTRAIELAGRGEGWVEPNPMVGCVIARDGRVVGEGWHHKFGGPHAEVEALQQAGAEAQGATAYVTLEPCCHHGKTPPCTEALIRHRVARVVVAVQDPFPDVAGQGLQQLRQAGVSVELGLLAERSTDVLAPYQKLVVHKLPWVIAKWAMTWDGRIATAAGHSQWISNAASRSFVHRMRGRMDAIVVGRGTATADDPLLTARPPGPRTALRIVCDTQARLALDSQLVRSANQLPVLIVVGPRADPQQQQRLQNAGCEVLMLPGSDPLERIKQLLNVLGSRQITNLLVEGGQQLLGSFFDARLIDEVHVFVAPKLVGGAKALAPIGGGGVSSMAAALAIAEPHVILRGQDVHLHGRIKK